MKRDPLINRGELVGAVSKVTDGWDSELIADEVLDYLRSRLTPDALSTFDLFGETDGQGLRLHRRIFGEDQ